MNSRDESLPMSPTKHFVAIFGPTPPISQSDIMGSDDFREEGDLCEDEDDDGGSSWHSNNSVGSRLGHLSAIEEESSVDEPEAKSSERVYPVDNSLAEKRSRGYFDIQLTVGATPIVSEGINSPKIVTDLDTDHFGRPRTAERPKTPLPERREQKKNEPFVRSSSPACIDCIVGGKDHHHGRAPVQSPQPSRTKGPLASSLETSSEPTPSEPTIAKRKSIILNDSNPPNFTTPPKLTREPSIPTLRRTGNLPVREYTPPREHANLQTPGSGLVAPKLRRTASLPSRESTPTRDQASLRLSIPTPPKEPSSNQYERPTPIKSFNPSTPSRQRVPAIPPTPPSTPAKRTSSQDFSRSNINLPTPVEEEPPTISTQQVEETTKSRHHHDHGPDEECPFVKSARSFREMRGHKSYSLQPTSDTPETRRSLSHSYSAPNIHQRSSSLPSNSDPSRLSSYGSYSRPTTPELSRLSNPYSYSRPGSSDGLRRPGSSDGFRRPNSTDGFRRPGSSDGFRRPGSSDGSRLLYPSYSRPSTPEVVFSGTGTRVPFMEGPESVGRSPSPPPPTIASSVGTSPSSSMVLQPAISFRKDTTQRTITRSISSEQLSVMDQFFGGLQRRLALEREGQNTEPESPVEELTPEPEMAKVEIPRIEVTEPIVAVPKAVEVPQNFITEFVIPRITKYYLQGQTFWNVVISGFLLFFMLGSLVTVSTGLVYFFGDGTTSGGLRGALFGRGNPSDDFGPLIAVVLFLCLFSWVTVYSRRLIDPEAKEDKSSSLFDEILGSQQAAPIRKFFSPRRLKRILLTCLIITGTSGLYLGGQVVVPPIVVGVNKGITIGVDYWNTLHSPAMEVPVEVETNTEMPPPWDDMDFVYFMPTEDDGESDEKHVSRMEGSQGTYYPDSDQGYFGDEERLGWGTIWRLGLALVAGPAGAMALRHRRPF